MKSSEVIQMLTGAIANTKKKGIEYIYITQLEEYAQKLQQVVEKGMEDVAIGDVALEEYKANLAAGLSSDQQRHEGMLEMLRATITTAQSALKSSLLINGGAAVALLAFIGRIWGNDDTQPVLEVLSAALLSYVFGVLSAAVAAGVTYFSQAGYAGEFGSISEKVGITGRVVAVLFVFAGYGLFALGSWLAYKAIGLG